jgi:hypothetical protein
MKRLPFFNTCLLTLACLLSGSSQSVPAFKLKPGTQQVYTISLKSTQKAYLSKLIQALQPNSSEPVRGSQTQDQTYEISLQGEMHTTIVQQEGSKAVLSYRLRLTSLRMVMNKEPMPDPERQALLRQVNESILLVEMDSQGKTGRVWTLPGTDPFVESILRNLVSLSQLSLTGTKSAKSWTAQEDSPEGRYTASYQTVNSKPAEVRLKKTIQKYTRVADQGMGRDITIRPSGSSDVLFHPKEGRLISIQSQIGQQTWLKNLRISEGTTRFSLQHKTTGTLPAAGLDALQKGYRQTVAQTKPGTLFGLPVVQGDSEDMQRQQLGDDTLETLMKAVRTLPENADMDTQTALYLKWRALLSLQPDTCQEVAIYLEKQKVESVRTRVLSMALQGAGHPKAQSALVRYMRLHKSNPDAMQNLIPVLADVSDATPESEQFLSSLTQVSDPNIATPARLGLGSMAKNLQSNSPERARSVVDRLLGALNACKADEERVSWLLALGNAGSDRALTTIMKYVQSPDDQVRYASISALRFIEQPQAEEILANALLSDKVTAVRMEAASAFGYRQMTGRGFRAHREAITREKDEDIRKTLLNNLWQAREAFPDVKKIVRQAAQSDSSQSVRNLARQLLSRE